MLCASALLVKLKFTGLMPVGVAIVATTLYGPPAVPLAVTVPLAAVPVALVVAGLPATLADAPAPSGVKLTESPALLTALLSFSCNARARGLANAVLVDAL